LNNQQEKFHRLERAKLSVKTRRKQQFWLRVGTKKGPTGPFSDKAAETIFY
jgi:hypothetical protein